MVSRQVNFTGFSRVLSKNTTVKKINSSLDIKDIVLNGEKPVIPLGAGLSYGDAFVSDMVLDCSGLNYFKDFDFDSGVLELEPGVTIKDVFKIFSPKGYYLNCTPGFSGLTIGGCISADIHGKNHGKYGGFSENVISLDIMVANGDVVCCSRTKNSKLFWATIGGYGATGVILKAKLQLYKMPGASFVSKSKPYKGFHNLLSELKVNYLKNDYSIVWLDLANLKFQNWLLMTSNFKKEDVDFDKLKPEFSKSFIKKPLGLLSIFYNSLTIRLFNCLYFLMGKFRPITNQSVRTCLFPWDSISNWNLLYGASGFYEYQCVIPEKNAELFLSDIISLLEETSVRPYLSAIKKMGPSQALNSYCVDGFSFLFDFKASKESEKLLNKFDSIVIGMRGKVYLAKDSRLSKKTYQEMYKSNIEWVKVVNTVNPDKKFSSEMIKRLDMLNLNE